MRADQQAATQHTAIGEPMPYVPIDQVKLERAIL